jgi:hypothetical protein
MSTPYKYIPSIDYINTLAFDYIETYSFQRGKKFEEDLKNFRADYERLKVRKEKRNNLTTAEEQQYNELNELLGFIQYLINDRGQFHLSSHKVNAFPSKDPVVSRLKEILRTDIIDIPQWLCAPVYIDAIVFYSNDGTIVSTLNVCLSCQYMELQRFVHLNADYKTYDQLHQFFLDIGHEVEQSFIR